MPMDQNDVSERLRLIQGISTAELKAFVDSRTTSKGEKDVLNSSTKDSESGARKAPCLSTYGTIYSREWLEKTSYLASQHMGVENMGPLLYSLIRFIKPKRILEVGAGYTTLFILQALKDNDEEMERIRLQHQRVSKSTSDEDENLWYVAKEMDISRPNSASAVLVCVDNEEHGVFTENMGGMNGVFNIAAELNLSPYFVPVKADAFEISMTDLLEKGNSSCHLAGDFFRFDFVWLDGITTDERFPDFFQSVWDNLDRNGGHVAVHSTLTNTITRSWLSHTLQTRISECCQRKNSSFIVQVDVKPLEAGSDIIKVESLFVDNICKSFPLPDGCSLLKKKVQGDGCSFADIISIMFGLKILRMNILVKNVVGSEKDAELLIESWASDIVENLPLDTCENGTVDELQNIQSLDIQYGSTVETDHLRGQGSTPNLGRADVMGFLEPHKRFQNSFSLFQKRDSSWSEPIYSWGP